MVFELSESSLKLLFERSPALLLVLDADLIIVAATDAYLVATMTDRAKIVGKKLFEVFPDNPNDPAATGVRNLKASFKRALETRRADTMPVQKYDIRKPDSNFEERYWSPVNTPIFADSGEFLYYLHRVEDVTEVVRITEAQEQNRQTHAAEKAKKNKELELVGELLRKERQSSRSLQESEDFLRLLLDSAADGFYAVDREGVTTSCNAAFVRMLGFERAEDAVGKKLHGIIHHSHFDGSPYPKEACPIYQAASSGSSAHVDSELFFRLDGTSFHVDYRVHPIVRDGEVCGAITTFTDITERRRTEDAFRQTLERLRFVMESMPQKIFTATASGEVDYFNAQWMEFTGLSFEQIRDWGWTQFIHPDDVRENVEVWKRSIDSGEPFHFEHRFRSKEGGYRWHLSRALPFRDDKGKVLMWIGSNTDVHDQKQAEIALLKSEKLAAVGRLAATIAHEINNPLEAVTNLLYLVRKDISMSERSHSYLQTAGKELDRVALIAQQTLGFYRDRGLPGWVDVSETINELLAVYSYKFRNHDLELEKELHESAKVFASAGEFRQVFSNLFINALDSIAQSTGGRIRIRVRPSRDWRNSSRSGVRISIADNGSGIGLHNRVKIFEPFFTTKEHIGTGLGLWLSSSLVRKHNGRIQVRSRVTPGESGSVFSVFWPTRPDEGPPDLEGTN